MKFTAEEVPEHDIYKEIQFGAEGVLENDETVPVNHLMSARTLNKLMF